MLKMLVKTSNIEVQDQTAPEQSDLAGPTLFG